MRNKNGIPRRIASSTEVEQNKRRTRGNGRRVKADKRAEQQGKQRRGQGGDGQDQGPEKIIRGAQQQEGRRSRTWRKMRPQAGTQHPSQTTSQAEKKGEAAKNKDTARIGSSSPSSKRSGEGGPRGGEQDHNTDRISRAEQQEKRRRMRRRDKRGQDQPHLKARETGQKQEGEKRKAKIILAKQRKWEHPRALAGTPRGIRASAAAETSTEDREKHKRNAKADRIIRRDGAKNPENNTCWKARQGGKEHPHQRRRGPNPKETNKGGKRWRPRPRSG